MVACDDQIMLRTITRCAALVFLAAPLPFAKTGLVLTLPESGLAMCRRHDEGPDRATVELSAGKSLGDAVGPEPGGPYNRAMSFDDYKVVLYRQEDGSWVAEIPALSGCYALMDTREAALAELGQVFALIAQEHQDRGLALPKDTTEIVHA